MQRSHAEPAAVRPAPRLSRTGLTLLLIAVAATPVVLVLYLWKTLPPVQQHPLAVVVERLDAAPLPRSDANGAGGAGSAGGAGERKLVLRNASDEPWTNLAVSLNREFHFHRPGRVSPGETVTLFLGRFALRNGTPFNPEAIEVRQLEVMARLPSGMRGVYKETVAAERVRPAVYPR